MQLNQRQTAQASKRSCASDDRKTHGRARQLCSGGRSTGHRSRQMFCCCQLPGMGMHSFWQCQIGKHGPGDLKDTRVEKRDAVNCPKAAGVRSNHLTESSPTQREARGW